jgi:hypothetical protein
MTFLYCYRNRLYVTLASTKDNIYLQDYAYCVGIWEKRRMGDAVGRLKQQQLTHKYRIQDSGSGKRFLYSTLYYGGAGIAQ